MKIFDADGQEVEVSPDDDTTFRFDVEAQAALLAKILNPVHDGMNSAYVALERDGQHRVTIDASYDLTPEESALVAAIYRGEQP